MSNHWVGTLFQHWGYCYWCGSRVIVQYYQVCLAFLLVTFWMEVLSLILITGIIFGCTHSTLLCFSEIGQWLCNFHSSVHAEHLISIIEVSQHHNRVALMWLICDNQCKLVQENLWAEPVLYNAAWWVNITPLHSISCTTSQLLLLSTPFLSWPRAVVFTLCLDAYWLYFDP